MNMPTTANDWQLYTCSMNCGTAARSLTAALKRVIKKVEDMKMSEIKKAGGLSRAITLASMNILDPVMNKYAEYGASDSEPYSVARWYLRKHFNLDPYEDIF